MKKLLIIEDDPMLKDLYRLLFRKLEIDFVILEDGSEILNELNEGEIGLILMDVNLKNTYLHNEKFDGLKFSRYIKERYYMKRIPILIVTAYSFNSSIENMMEESLADDYMIKPITDYNQLIEKINKLVIS